MTWQRLTCLRSFRVLLVLPALAGMGSLSGCPDSGKSGGSQPVITLTATDCPKGQINMTVKATEFQQGAKWRTKVEVTVTCGGQPIKAEIKISVSGGWWTEKFQTDAQGKLTATGPPKDGEPSGQSVTVTVQGSDGETQKQVPIQ
jgi:hypothetical protein